jgi:hypothetical protein
MRIGDCSIKVVLVTADSDFGPLVKLLTVRFPAIRVSLVVPPKRLQQTRELGGLVSERDEITAGRLGTCRLPQNVKDGKGRVVARRPTSYYGFKLGSM